MVQNVYVFCCPLWGFFNNRSSFGHHTLCIYSPTSPVGPGPHINACIINLLDFPESHALLTFVLNQVFQVLVLDLFRSFFRVLVVNFLDYWTALKFVFWGILAGFTCCFKINSSTQMLSINFALFWFFNISRNELREVFCIQVFVLQHFHVFL